MSLFETVQHMSPATIHKPQAADASATTSGAANNTSSATISANAFLQLLVTELKNQDPTANQDPNAYVDQLVQVNSLQQLIQINQSLGSGTGAQPGQAPTSASGSGN